MCLGLLLQKISLVFSSGTSFIYVEKIKNFNIVILEINENVWIFTNLINQELK